MSNAFGAHWYDEDRTAQFDQPDRTAPLEFVVGMLNESGPAGYATNGVYETLKLFTEATVVCGSMRPLLRLVLHTRARPKWLTAQALRWRRTPAWAKVHSPT